MPRRQTFDSSLLTSKAPPARNARPAAQEATAHWAEPHWAEPSLVRGPPSLWSPFLPSCHLIVGPREFFRGAVSVFSLPGAFLFFDGTLADSVRGIDLPVVGVKVLERSCVCVGSQKR